MRILLVMLVAAIGVEQGRADLSVAAARNTSGEQALPENKWKHTVDGYDREKDAHSCNIQECLDLVTKYDKLPTQVDGSKGYQGANQRLGPMDVPAVDGPGSNLTAEAVGPFKRSKTEKFTLTAQKVKESLNATAADATQDDPELTTAVRAEEQRVSVLNGVEKNNTDVAVSIDAKRTAEVEAQQQKLFVETIAQQRNVSVAAAKRIVERVNLCKCVAEVKRLNSPTPPAAKGEELGAAAAASPTMESPTDTTSSDEMAELGDAGFEGRGGDGAGVDLQDLSRE